MEQTEEILFFQYIQRLVAVAAVVAETMVYLVVLVAVAQLMVAALQLAGRERLGKVMRVARPAVLWLLVEAGALALLVETESVELVEQVV